jgi:NAD-dependent DNA ligase
MADIVKKLLKSNVDSVEVISDLSIEQLEKVITYATDKYYNSPNPVITDAIYDILIDFLKMRAPKSQVLKTIGAKVKSKDKVKLDYWLGSMNKIKPPSNQLNLWTKKYKPPYNLSDKLDGVSALLTYNKQDGQIKMFTRGTATEGMDITPLIKYLNLPDHDTVATYCKKNTIKGTTNLIAFRGELIIKEKVFEKNWSKTLKNGRNSVAGLVNSKTINPDLASDTELVVYEVVDPFYPIDKQLKIVKDIGFNTVTNKVINEALTYEILSKYLKERRTKSEYQIDGIIVTSCVNHDRNIDGNPEYAFAFKDILEDQKAKTTVVSIEWNVSKDGFIKPTILIEPVSIGGVEIKRVTGFNAKFIVENKLGPGANVEIIRSGDVIPKIEKVIKVAKSGKGSLPDMDYEWNETKVDIILNDHKDSSSVLIKNIYYFFSKLETKGLGEKNVEKMVEAGLDTVPKILAADKERFLMVEGFGEKTADNLVASIKKALINVPLAKLMSASNKLGHGLGEERMKQVLAVYPNLMTEYKKWTKKEFINNIKEINGWEEKTASLLVNNFGEFIKFYMLISKYVGIEEVKKIKTLQGNFTNKTVVFTGFRDKELEGKIEAQGGKIGSSVSKNTDYLVVKEQSSIDEPTDKVSKAISLGIKIITKDKLVKMLG